MKCEVPRLTRCCFCMPLRRGIITFGYVGVVLSIFMIGIWSYFVHCFKDFIIINYIITYLTPLDYILILTIFCMQLLANIILIYGAHRNMVLCLKIFYYYSLSTIGAILILEIVICKKLYFMDILELLTLTFVMLCCQMYLLILVRNLLTKLEQSNTHQFHNKLNEIVIGERNIGNDVSDNDIN